MKTTIDIPDEVLQDAMKYTGASTKREAIVTAVKDFNQRRKMAALVRHFGTCKELMTPSELEHLRGSE
jgi:Arc/MetJ family transcription regulator